MTTTLDPSLAAEPAPVEEDGQERRIQKLQSSLGLIIVVLAIASGLITFTILTGLTPVSPTPNVVIALMLLNGMLVLALIGVISWRVTALWLARKRNIAGARLHVRMVSLFALVALFPALLVALFASVTLDRGLDAWFSKRTRTIVENALNVAQAYVQEHGQVIRIEATSMARDLDRVRQIYDADPARFRRILAAQAAVRGLAGAYLIKRDKSVVMKVTASQEPPLVSPPDAALAQAQTGEVAVMSPGETNRVRSLVKLGAYDDTYLYIYRYVDPRVLDHVRTAYAGKAEYDSLEMRRYGVQFTFALMYVGVSLVFLLTAIWFGVWVADRIVQPITRLVGAARRVSEGELDVKVPVRRNEGDLATLGRTFNQMTDQLQSQRDDLISANHMLDERRRFTEAVLSGVSAGVIGLDSRCRIKLVNRSAARLLGLAGDKIMGQPLVDVVPEMAAVLDRALRKVSGNAEGQVILKSDGSERTLTVRVTTEYSREKEHGYVVTFDDITELVTAQRNSAWADIARRIAHEIKNPLTPIQLSAERLKRKYSHHIEHDRDVFEQCTETIIRQVGDLGRMVDEFSAFARMPKAVLEAQNLNEIVKQAVFLQQVSRGDVDFELKLPKKPIELLLDRRLIAQAVSNLVKNATEAIEACAAEKKDHRGKITVKVYQRKDNAYVDVIDNGIGLPHENRQRLLEPYMTTREKGTGLGLAIVKKVMEEHHGRITLHDAPGRGECGTLVRLEMPLRSSGEVRPAAKAKTSAGKRAKANVTA